MKRFLVVITFSLFIGAAILFYTLFASKRKIGYIATNQVFNEFLLKKEMEDELTKLRIRRQAYLDSMKLNIQMADSKPTDLKSDARLIEYKKNYLIKEAQFGEENEALLKQYNDKVWSQLNQFVEDYGRQNHYDYLFGTTGQGNLMYASEGENVTKEVVEFINRKYSGKK